MTEKLKADGVMMKVLTKESIEQRTSNIEEDEICIKGGHFYLPKYFI